MWRVTGVSAWLAILIVSALSVVVLPTKVIAGSLTSSVDRTDEPLDRPATTRVLPAIPGQDWVFGLARKSCRHEVGGERRVLKPGRSIRNLGHDR